MARKISLYSRPSKNEEFTVLCDVMCLMCVGQQQCGGGGGGDCDGDGDGEQFSSSVKRNKCESKRVYLYDYVHRESVWRCAFTFYYSRWARAQTLISFLNAAAEFIHDQLVVSSFLLLLLLFCFFTSLPSSSTHHRCPAQIPIYKFRDKFLFCDVSWATKCPNIKEHIRFWCDSSVHSEKLNWMGGGGAFGLSFFIRGWNVKTVLSLYDSSSIRTLAVKAD